MSLEAFQHAFAALVASPVLSRRLALEGDGVLVGYDLDPTDRHRLATIVRQRGMSTNCTLYRANRLEAIYTLMPLTCQVLGEDLRREAEEYWSVHAYTDLQFAREIFRFAGFLRARLDSGVLDNSYASEVLAFEVASNELRFLPRGEILEGLMATTTAIGGPLALHPLVRLVAFQHDPRDLLPLLRDRRTPPAGLRQVSVWVLLDATREEMRVRVISAGLAEALCAIRDRSVPIARSDGHVARLLDAGLVVQDR
jgi:hypothetical protein